MSSTWATLHERLSSRVLAQSLIGAKCGPDDPLDPHEMTTNELNSMTLRLAASTLNGHITFRDTITAEPDGHRITLVSGQRHQ
ncbi:MAG: hypothetical protein H7062_07435 [Candidatus Saccharimonas sp.]|nr:hypothetical protein [Planctomycetaceae bacterium]